MGFVIAARDISLLKFWHLDYTACLTLCFLLCMRQPASLLDTLHWILCWASLCDLLSLAPLYFGLKTDRSRLNIQEHQGAT